MTTTSVHRTTHINPMSWCAELGYDQAQLRRAPSQLLTVAGQGPVDDNGFLLHEGDVCAQLSLTMRNVETVLAAAGMDLGDVTRMTVYVTDMDAALASWGAVTERLVLAAAAPPITLLGVSRLTIPGMAVQIEVTAAR